MTFTGELGHGLLILCCCPFYLPPALRAPILLYLVMPSGPGLLSPHARISLFGLCNIYIKGLSHDYSFIIYLRWSQIHVNLLCWSVNPDPLPPMPQTHKQKFNFLITLFEFKIQFMPEQIHLPGWSNMRKFWLACCCKKPQNSEQMVCGLAMIQSWTF